jgi:RNA polymerase sigma factor (sigma-70 family)
MNYEENCPAGGRDRIERVLASERLRWLAYVARVVGNQADAEDVLQEAVGRVLLCGRIFDSDQEARRYLARAVSNAAMDMYQLRKRERMVCVPVKDQNLADECRIGPQENLELEESVRDSNRMLRLLSAALPQLPKKQIEALRITLGLEGCSIRDAGAQNGIAYSTLRYRSRKGLRNLRKLMLRALRLGKDGGWNSSPPRREGRRGHEVNR